MHNERTSNIRQPRFENCSRGSTAFKESVPIIRNRAFSQNADKFGISGAGLSIAVEPCAVSRILCTCPSNDGADRQSAGLGFNGISRELHFGTGNRFAALIHLDGRGFLLDGIRIAAFIRNDDFLIIRTVQYGSFGRGGKILVFCRTKQVQIRCCNGGCL